MHPVHNYEILYIAFTQFNFVWGGLPLFFVFFYKRIVKKKKRKLEFIGTAQYQNERKKDGWRWKSKSNQIFWNYPPKQTIVGLFPDAQDDAQIHLHIARGGGL